MELPFDPALLQGYEIVSFIDRGGMGAVYRARQKSLQRSVALKVLDARLEAESSRQRFLQEAHLAARLLHPNIVAVFDAGEVEGVPYIVFELIEGEPLAHRIARVGRLPVRDALSMAKGIADGLAAAHAAGVVHRDLKPQNILIAAGDQAKIADFGIGKSLHGEGLRTRENLILGTPLYMSPEQAQGEELGPATDIYSLGVVLYEMLAGAPPFTGTVTAVLQAHISVTPPSILALEPDVPQSVARVLDRMLEKEPGKRWSSAAELSSALNKALLLTKAEVGRARADGPSGKTRRSATANAGPEELNQTIPVTPSGGRERDTIRTDPRVRPQQPKSPPAAPAQPIDWRPVAVTLISVAMMIGGALVYSSRRAQPPPLVSEPAAAPLPTSAANPPTPAPIPTPRADAWSPEQTGAGFQRDAGPTGRPGPVGASKFRKFYWYPDEPTYQLIRPKNRRDFASETEARKAGYMRRPEERGNKPRKDQQPAADEE